MKMTVRLFIALVVIGCFALVLFRDLIPGQTGVYLSEWELRIAGYYAYVLPEKEQEQRNWSRSIYIYSFGCAEGESDDKYRPMRTWYKNEDGEIDFDISISPRSDPFLGSYSLDYTEVVVESDWIANHQVRIYTAYNGFPVAIFNDIFGMNVTASGNVSQDELINLLRQLDYVGPNPASIENPWAEACS